MLLFRVINSFKSKPLKAFWEKGDASGVGQSVQRIRRILDLLNAATAAENMNVPGYYFHRLHGDPTRYSVRVSGNWRITFEWAGNDACRVDLEDYH